MTEEQLFHLAEEFANKLTPITDPFNTEQNIRNTIAIKSFIAGYNTNDDNNHWVDVNNENNRPRNGEQIIIAFGDNARNLLIYYGKETFEIWEAHHWMPIPQLPRKNE